MHPQDTIPSSGGNHKANNIVFRASVGLTINPSHETWWDAKTNIFQKFYQYHKYVYDIDKTFRLLILN